MKNVTTAYLKAMEERRDFYPEGTIKFSNGTVKELARSDFIASSNSYTQSAESNSFPLGACVSKSVSLTINNSDDRWSEYDFLNAKVTLYTKFKLDDGTVESILEGTFTITEPETYGATISFTAMDDCYKLDQDYSTGLTYPASLGEIVRDCCSTCDVSLQTTTFANSTFMVAKMPSNVTHRQMIGYCAMFAGGNAVMDEYNRLYIKTYDFSTFANHPKLDGGIYDTESSSEYKSGTSADGGTFNPWNDGDSYDAGEFEAYNKIHNLWQYKSGYTISTDNIIVTGVKLTSNSTDYMSGTDGYVLQLTNPLADSKEQNAVDLIGELVIGLTFRSFTIDHIAYPLAEFMDCAYLEDAKGNEYETVITDINFIYGGFTTLKCSADSPIRNSSKYSSAATQAEQAAKELINTKLSDYEQAVDQLTSLITQSFGIYKTEETLADGSTVFYLHNKPTLAQSSTQWKMTADAFAVSTDYGKTWKAGMDSNGNAVVNVLSAIGINFEWAKGGMLTLGGNKNVNGVLRILDANGNAIGYWSQSGITANSGDIAGFMINDHKIFAGNSNTGTVVMQKPASNTTWAFAAGGKSHDSYSDCPFRVSKSGTLVAKDATIVGDITAHTGSFNAITLNGSNLVNNTMTGSLSGGYYNNGYVSGGTLGYCDLGGTTLSTGNSGYVASDSSSNVTIMGERFAYLRGGKNYLFITSGGTNAMGGNLSVTGKITAQSVTTTKSRAATASVQSLAKSAAMVSVMALEESTKATVNDCGTGTLDENGELEIIIDATLADEVDSSYLPVVFLTKYGEGDIWVDADKLTHDSVMVRGTPNLKFSWLTKYMDAEGSDLEVRAVAEDASGDVDYNTTTMLEYELTSVDEEQSAYNYLIETESLETDYSAEGAAAYEEYEGSLTS